MTDKPHINPADPGKNEIELNIDTGFSWALMLPLKIIETLCLEEAGEAEYTLADGSVGRSPVYEASISRGKRMLSVPVVPSGADFSLIGMEMLNRARMIMEPSREILIVEPI